MKIIIMKWFSSLCLLTGILCTNLNIYPFNIYFQSIGAISWIIVSYAVRDRSMMLNFLPQIPLFAIGYYVLLVGY
ncbi:MAG: Uncharacterised protein [Gammaproteobacteria bacterium]|nr:MAG: Uncharacterised protein [Gammaproteobacteria bacterium]